MHQHFTQRLNVEIHSLEVKAVALLAQLTWEVKNLAREAAKVGIPKESE